MLPSFIDEAIGRFHFNPEERKDLYSKRKQFVRDFDDASIRKMKMDDYVEGKGDKSSFCYRVEHELEDLGRIRGASSSKFGLYYSKKKGTYKHAKKFGDSPKKAFSLIKKDILGLLKAGKEEDIDALASNRISPMFKGKILSLYYPDRYLSIFSKDHLDKFLIAFNLDTPDLMRKDPVFKREVLRDFKNSNPELRDWSLDKFMRFLYTEFHPDTLVERFPYCEYYQDADYSSGKSVVYDSKGGSRKRIDYEKAEKEHREIGKRGEELVYKRELERVSRMLNISIDKAKQKVKYLAAKGEPHDHDILSINEDGSPIYIEVKATRAKSGEVDFFLTEHEKTIASSYGDAYFVYLVWDVYGKHPKISILKNPTKSSGCIFMPVLYRVPVKLVKNK